MHISSVSPSVDAWAVVIPVKRLALAKTRLRRFAGSLREELALAFAGDTIAAAAGCPNVREILVVTDDEVAAALARKLGCTVEADGPDAGLNAALARGVTAAGRRWSGLGLAAVSSDLPALRSAELRVVLEAAARVTTAFLPDAEGIGTTVLTALEVGAFVPRFGRRSRAEHRAAGVAELQGGDVPSVRRDVDTEVQLYDARRLGVGSRTAEVLSRIDSLDR